MNWARDAVFYHIYPLGMCGAPQHNDFCSAPTPRLMQISAWLDHMKVLGVNALYLGPLFESSAHGYDTADYYWVDRRLGDNQTLHDLVAACHNKGIRVILDGVFHHVGRHFWAFRDLQEHGPDSPYRDWFSGVDFSQRSPLGDAFSYDPWSGHYELVKLNLQNPDVRKHLLGAVQQWMSQFGIDGLRLDVADALDRDFLHELVTFCHEQHPDFWLMGEVIHGDYRQWANPDLLDSVTNYECYKGLFSSHNDQNYFEVAYSLQRQFGETGIYRDLPLYAFADNHDVDRIASTLRHQAHLYPLHLLLFTIPGVPSIYYGSEWGIAGRKTATDDLPVRPQLRIEDAVHLGTQPDLASAIARLAQIRHEHPALRYGNYQQLMVAHEQLAFARETADELLLIVVNVADSPSRVVLPRPGQDGQAFVDLLDPRFNVTVRQGQLVLDSLPRCWGRILVRK